MWYIRSLHVGPGSPEGLAVRLVILQSLISCLILFLINFGQGYLGLTKGSPFISSTGSSGSSAEGKEPPGLQLVLTGTKRS